MMKNVIAVLAACLVAAAAPPQAPPRQEQRAKPKLVVLVAIDQFRYDYLTRFRSEFKGGLARMLEKGAVFANAHYEHFPTVTAVGHATMLSGATPSVSGIVGNEWFDRESGKQVSSVSDDKTQVVGSTGADKRGASPHRLLVSTLGDELKMADSRAKVIGISSKDRSAILPVGRMADAAFWFDISTGDFITSTYYTKEMPGWAAEFNKSRSVDQWIGKTWDPVEGGKPYLTLGAAAGRSYYGNIDRSPYGNDLLVAFAQAAVEGEQLGADNVTDVLSISFSANDRVGHSLGPDAAEIRDISIRTDRTLGVLFTYLDKKVGAGNWLAVLTADHGVAPMPEVMAKRKMPGGRIPEGAVLNAVQSALTTRYGPGQYVVGKSGPAPYLNHDLIREKKLNLEEVQSVAADAVRAVPHIYRVYTRSELEKGRVLTDLIDTRVRAGFHSQRASDLFVVSEPYWLFEAKGTSHGTPYNYDSHVPVVFLGPGIKAGKYYQRAAVNDIAPTLATMLEVQTPSGAAGRVLHEMFE